MSDDEISFQGVRFVEFHFSYVDPEFKRRILGLPKYDITITQDFFVVRRRLTRLRLLMLRPRGRLVLGVKTCQRRITIYGAKITGN